MSYTATSLNQGMTYQFKVETRNEYGFSVYSNTVSILTAQVPAQPSAPTTLWSPDNVIVSWTAPDDGGSPITGYIVKIKQNDNLFSTDLIHCDQSALTAI